MKQLIQELIKAVDHLLSEKARHLEGLPAMHRDTTSSFRDMCRMALVLSTSESPSVQLSPHYLDGKIIGMDIRLSPTGGDFVPASAKVAVLMVDTTEKSSEVIEKSLA